MIRFLLIVLFVPVAFCSNAQSWIAAGPNDSNQVSFYSAAFTNLAIDPSGNPYVIYKDAGQGNKATVARFIGGTWNIVGSAGFTFSAIEYADIAIAPDGTPYIAIQTQGDPDLLDASVLKFTGGVWSYVGSPAISQQFSFNSYSPAFPSISLAIGPDNAPYLAYSDFNDPSLPLAATVKRFNGTTWQTIGLPGFTGENPVNSQAIALDFDIAPDGTPYLLFTDNGPNVPVSEAATLMKFNGVEWVLEGQQGFSAGTISFPALKISDDGMPFVAYCDHVYSNKVTVKKFDGLNWENVGTQGFSTGAVDYVTLDVTFENLPVVSYKDLANGNRASVQIFDGLNWNYPGNLNFSNGAVQYPRMALTSTGVPFIVYQDAGNLLKATVKKFDGDWLLVGEDGFGDVPSTEIAAVASKNSNILYAAFKNNISGKASVKSYSGSWSAVGSPEFSAGSVDHLSIALSPVDETIYVAYRDNANGGKATVAYLANDGWATAGVEGFSPGVVDGTSLDIAPDGTPYLAFIDAANGNFLTVMRFNGSIWEVVGTPGFSAGIVDHIDLAIAPNGDPYVTYFDYANGKATAKRFSGSWLNVGPAGGFSAGVANYISLVINQSNVPFVAFQNGVNGNAVVNSFNGTNWISVGGNISPGAATHISLIIDGNGNPTVAYQDATNNYRTTVEIFQAGNWNLIGSAGFSAGAASSISLVNTPDNIIHTVYSDGYAWAESFTTFIPVPVHLYSFTAVKWNNQVKLNWVTSSEINNDHFIVEHSSNGLVYSEIGRIDGNDEENSFQYYSLIHSDPVVGLNHYRLKQVDLNGKVNIFPIRTVKFNASDLFEAKLYPNPATQIVFIEGDFKNIESIQIFNAAGQLVFQQTNLKEGNKLEINVAGYKPGTYFLNLNFKEGNKSLQFIRK